MSNEKFNGFGNSLDFGKCLWFLVPSDCHVFDLHSKVCSEFSTYNFSPHVSIKVNVDDNDVALWKKKFYGTKDTIEISLSSPVKVVADSFKGVYNLRLTVDIFGCTIPSDPHLSLAYRTTEPYSIEEIASAQKIIDDNLVLDNLRFSPLLAWQNCKFDKIFTWKGHLI